MQRDLLKARLSKLPVEAPVTDIVEDEDEADEVHDAVPALGAPRLSGSSRRVNGTDYSAVSGAEYFSSALEVDVPVTADTTAVFRVYYTPPAPDSRNSDTGPGTVFLFVHGAGYSAFSWALCSKTLVEHSRGQVGVLAYDARGHGKSEPGKTRLTNNQGQGVAETGLSMSLASMVDDLVNILKNLFPDRDHAPSFVLVGHSMGGAVVAEACPRVQAEVGAVTGIVVVDVVEGSAMEALAGMTGLIEAQPKSFASIEKAIQWHIKSKTIRNLDSARVSVPPLVRKTASDSTDTVHWRADLSATTPFWEGWFKGLSSKFLAARTARMLLLAGTDRLDKELMIGQMQGKFQLEVFPETGHCVQEDAPEKTADLLLKFWRRNDRTDVLKGVKKVGEK
ncbi:Protein phosphatase methylesterase 1 [Microbotryomycetes sp. JL201]|nr:Protein phosphatase methylesterase 1 [Microbotryomycetes sp. JL201]